MTLSIPSAKEGRVVPSLQFAPQVVITMPFYPLVMPKPLIEQKLKALIEITENYILSHYTMQQAIPVFTRLQNVINQLNYYTHQKAIAIFVSPVFEKIIYLNFEMKEQVIVDKKFKLTDIALNKKEEIKYLVLLLKKDCSSLFIGNQQNLQLIKHNYYNNYKKEIPGLPLFKTSPSLQNIIKWIDDGLRLILRSYHFPVYVAGEEKLVNYFKQVTNNRHSIASYNILPTASQTKNGVWHIMGNHLPHWYSTRYKLLFSKIEKAKEENKLSFGTNQIWTLGKGKGALLVAENNYSYPSHVSSTFNFPLSQQFAFYIKDAADGVAQTVLENGGNIELVNKDSLSPWGHLVLIQA